MSEETNDGGTAFPSTDAYGFVSVGLSLRDWFAGQALQGLLAARNNCHNSAHDAYLVADMMLDLREPKDTTTAQHIALGIGGGR